MKTNFWSTISEKNKADFGSLYLKRLVLWKTVQKGAVTNKQHGLPRVTWKAPACQLFQILWCTPMTLSHQEWGSLSEGTAPFHQCRNYIHYQTGLKQNDKERKPLVQIGIGWESMGRVYKWKEIFIIFEGWVSKFKTSHCHLLWSAVEQTTIPECFVSSWIFIDIVWRGGW